MPGAEARPLKPFAPTATRSVHSYSAHLPTKRSRLTTPRGQVVTRFRRIKFLLDSETLSHIMTRMPRPTPRQSPYRVQVLDRALAALEILANRDGECSLVDLCAEMKLHKSTV